MQGHLPDLWRDWFENLTIENRPDGEAVLSGPVPDQAALHGILRAWADEKWPYWGIFAITESHHFCSSLATETCVLSGSQL